MTSRAAAAAKVAMVIVLTGCSTPVTSPSSEDLKQAYEAAIRVAAIHTPEFSVPLRTIGPEQSDVNVVTFTEWGVPSSTLRRYTWVSLPAQLHEMCRNKSDTVLAIQQILGLPPAPNPSRPEHRWEVISFKVMREALFRPCPSGTDIAAASCTTDEVPKLDAETTHFLLNQIWTSDRLGGGANAAVAGYPFTGMGWSYNWDPASASHIGVSEYVVKPGAEIREPQTSTPDEFCHAK
jgi:hypothetical protein